MRVLLTTEGTYPFFDGGVSTWAHALVAGLPQHQFTVVSVIPTPHVRQRYELPPNAGLVPVPLWGAERLEEYLSTSVRPRRRDRRAVGSRFLPLLADLVDELLVATADAAAVGRRLSELADYCTAHDLRAALRDERAWNVVLDRLAAHPLYRNVSVGGAVDLARSLYRYLTPLTLPVPEVQVAHSSAAAFCALPALVAKLRYGAPLVLTEHGVYLRERILQLIREDTSAVRKVLFANLYRGVAQAAYHHADAVIPVCSYNTMWEEHLSVPAQRMNVIYNGVDPRRFDAEQAATRRPTVAFVGRIDPLKDVLTLVSAAALVHERMPEVVFRLYGGDSDDEYGRRCRQAVREYGLTETVFFEGPTADAAAAYRDCDVVALSSMSEGFPFTVIEAMMSARPVVATSVGGVPEALADQGVLVAPQSPYALADGLTRVLGSPAEERAEMGAALRARAVAVYSQERFLADYDALYERSDGHGRHG